MAFVRAGELRQVVRIQAPVQARDGFGGASTEWTDVATTRARVISLEGSESLDAKKAMAVFAEVTHEVTIRYRPGITAQMRLLFKGRVLNIVRPINTEERNIELVLLCGEQA